MELESRPMHEQRWWHFEIILREGFSLAHVLNCQKLWQMPGVSFCLFRVSMGMPTFHLPQLLIRQRKGREHRHDLELVLITMIDVEIISLAWLFLICFPKISNMKIWHISNYFLLKSFTKKEWFGSLNPFFRQITSALFAWHWDAYVLGCTSRIGHTVERRRLPKINHSKCTCSGGGEGGPGRKTLHFWQSMCATYLKERKQEKN